MTATSSAVAERTVPSPVPVAAPAPALTCPNAPKSTFVIERFIARPMSSVSIVPDAPTSMPLTISTLFESSKHDADARSEEHTSELQSLAYLVCRLLLEKKKKTTGCCTFRRHCTRTDPIDA